TNKADVVVPVANVPVQKNHRTNIVGSLFTQDANFNIIIDQNFDQPDNNVIIPFIDPAGVGEAVQEPGATVNIAPGSELTINMSQLAEGVTINGNGSTIIFENGNAAEHRINTENVVIENVTILNHDYNTTPLTLNSNNVTLRNVEFEDISSSYGIAINGNDPDGEILLENVTIDGSTARVGRGLFIHGKNTIRIINCYLDATYPFNCDGSQGDVIVENSTLLGWTSWNNDYNGDGTQHTVTFTNCKFGKGYTGYATVRPYTTSYFTNCEFSADVVFSPCNSCTSTFTNCTIPDLTAFLPAHNNAVGSFAIIDGVTYTYNSGGEAWEVVE
ncbi:MAG: hypothetical protein IJT30_07720, partial [Muribaculaceae bacterium]|nr:hypothetical protein [Muribaculaceae bacterium]